MHVCPSLRTSMSPIPAQRSTITTAQAEPTVISTGLTCYLYLEVDCLDQQYIPRQGGVLHASPRENTTRLGLCFDNLVAWPLSSHPSHRIASYRSAAHYSTVQYNTVQNGTIRYSAAQRNAAQQVVFGAKESSLLLQSSPAPSQIRSLGDPYTAGSLIG